MRALLPGAECTPERLLGVGARAARHRRRHAGSAIAGARLVRRRRCPRRAAAAALGLVEVACLLRGVRARPGAAPVIGAIRAGRGAADLDPRTPRAAAIWSRGAHGARAGARRAARARARRATARRHRGAGGGAARERREVRTCRRRRAPTCTSSPRARAAARAWCWSRPAPRRARAPLRSLRRRAAGAWSRYDARAGAARASARPARRGDALARAAARGRSALALAEMVGGMHAALDMTVAYVKEREQFGQKIARVPGGAAPGRRHGDGLHRGAPSRLAGDHAPGGGHRAGQRAGERRRPSSAQAFKRLTLGGAPSARRRRLRRRAPAALPQRARPERCASATRRRRRRSPRWRAPCWTDSGARRGRARRVGLVATLSA